MDKYSGFENMKEDVGTGGDLNDDSYFSRNYFNIPVND